MRKDLILNSDGSLKIVNGDFVVGPSDLQNGKLLMYSEPGTWRQNPLVGLGLRKMINTKFTPLAILSFKKQVRLQFENDGYTVKSVNMTNSQNVVVDYE